MRISDWSSDVCSSDLANVAGRAFARTTHFFMAMVAARLVVSYANPPQMVLKTVAFLFTIAAVFQCAIWAREIILGLVERSEERRRGKGGVSTCRSRWSPDH